MFGSLKNKLKGWIKKNNEESEEEAPKAVESKKKTKTLEKKKSQKVENTKISSKEAISKDETPKVNYKTIEKKKFFSKFSKKLDNEKFEELFEELELILLQNNVAYEAVDAIKASLKDSLLGKSLSEVNLSQELQLSIENLLLSPPNFLDSIKNSLKDSSPFIILFSGINGAGKTTTIAKIANYLQKNNLSVCLAAADTFRAASIEQLEQHASKLNVPIIKKDYGSDPAAVGFDAVSYAKKNNVDVVLIDTAGRMQNKDSLMKEIEKISKVTNPHMKIFLGESITGNDATTQAKAFNDALDLTGIILSKADVDEKGGTAISVSHVTKKPILFLGTGQEYGDLEIFDKKKLIEKLGL